MSFSVYGERQGQGYSVQNLRWSPGTGDDPFSPAYVPDQVDTFTVQTYNMYDGLAYVTGVLGGSCTK